MHWLARVMHNSCTTDRKYFIFMFATDVLSNNNWFSFFANCSHLFILQTLAKSQAIYNSLLLSKEASEVSNVTIVE